MRVNKFLLTVAALCIFAVSVFAQGDSGEIAGTVTDQVGAAIPGAEVKLVNKATNVTRTTTTGGNGDYAFQLLPAGRYSVEISANGFQTSVGDAIVNITQTTTVNRSLVVTGVGDVTVNIDAPVAQVDTAVSGRVVTGETISQLPLPTRNFQQLLTLSAGAQNSLTNSTDLGRGDTTITVNGQRTTSNSVRINGIDANSIGTNSTPNIAVPASDTLQEFIVQTSLYDAASGRNAGGNIEAITRGGSNEFHGNAFYFLRNKALNANEPFLKARGFERPVATRNQFGGMLGGPVIKDRVLFFFSYQGTDEKNGVSLLNSLTSPVIPAGLTDNNRTAAGLGAAFGLNPAFINPVALNILNAKLPNGAFAIPSSGSSSTNPFSGIVVPQSGESTFKENQFNFNGDFIFSDRHNIAAKFFIADNPTTQANYNFAGLGNGERQLIGFGGDMTIKQKLYSITDTFIFSPNVVNQLKLGYNRLRVTSVPEEPFTAASLGITSPLANEFAGAPTIRVSGLDGANFFFGSAPLADQSSRINAYSIGDTLSVSKGDHRIKVGGEFRYSTVKFYFNAFSRGQMIFTSFADFLTGGSPLGTSFGISLIGSGDFTRSFRVKDWNGFIQDDWKVSKRLTINLGLRYDFYGLPVDTDGRLVNFIPSQFSLGAPPNGIVQAENGNLAGVPKVEKTLVPVDKNNFAPRIGFAYQVADSPNIVIRGGYGIYFDRISTRYANTQLFNYPYFSLPVGFVSPLALPGLRSYSSPFAAVPPPSQFPLNGNIPTSTGAALSGVFVDPELQTPYIEQYNLGMQWQLPGDLLLDVGYVGNRGKHLLQVITLNQPTYNPATNSFTTPYPAGVSANKNVTGGIQQIQTTSLSRYNSLQVSLSKRFSSGLQFLTSFTKGFSTDYYSGTALNELGNVPGDQFNWKTNRGRSDFNREDRLIISGAYDLPFKFDSGAAKYLLGNWQIAGIAVFQSGLPFSIINSNDTSIISRANLNPTYTGGPVYTSGNVRDRLNGYFKPAAFVTSCPTITCAAATGAVTNPFFDPNNPFGNTIRNGFIGPGQKNIDISFIKMIPFTERIRGEFRTEMFNVFNWVNYANPNNNMLAANFGRIERASSGPRVIQFGFKLAF